jgi:cytoskeletal protein CcmA (bactofilin family)
MFNKRKQPPIRSLVAQGSQIEGTFRFVDGLRIDGALRGNVVAEEGKPSILVISESGSVEGTVRAGHVIISGRVTGPVHAETMLELQPKARIEGDVYYRALEMHEGALIDGQLHPISSSDAKPLLTLAANNPGR